MSDAKSMIIKLNTNKLGEYASQLGRSGFDLPDELLQIMPQWWLDLGIKKSKHQEVMARYLLPYNYSMDVTVNNDHHLDKLSILKGIDATYCKSRPYQRWFDSQLCSGAGAPSRGLWLAEIPGHGHRFYNEWPAGSAQCDQVKALEKKLTGSASMDGAQLILDFLDLDKAAKFNKINKELGDSKGGNSKYWHEKAQRPRNFNNFEP